MHEWALAESIVLYLREQGYTRASKLIVYMGLLQSIDKDVFLFALNELFRNEGLNIGEVVIEDEDPVLRCNTCNYTWVLEVKALSSDVIELVHFVPEVIHLYHKCPRCGSRDFEILRGRGISRIEVIT